jgi:GNAT superfamily N-acetyltransferase
MASIIPLAAGHVDAAARLFLDHYRAARAAMPELPPRDTQQAAIAERLSALLQDHPGAAAMDGDTLVGYFAGYRIDEFHGTQRGVFCPEWAHAASGARRAEVYHGLYDYMSRVWDGDGVVRTALTLYADDEEALQTWHWHGFGLLVVDAMRPTTPVNAEPVPGLEIRQATAEDADTYAELVSALGTYLATPPIFRYNRGPAPREVFADRLAAPTRWVWLATCDGGVCGFVQAESPIPSVTFSVQAETSAGINGAYVRPEWRAKDVASALVDRVVSWARERGMETCSVDFESSNILARRFWLRHFRPVCYSLLRCVDERTVSGA